MDSDAQLERGISGSRFLDAMAHAPFSVVLTDPNKDDNPIVYVNNTFTAITGYAREFALGRNCRFLQGDERDQAGIKLLRTAIADEKEVTVELRNFRPDGEMFINRLMISPLYGEDGTLTYFLGLQVEVDQDENDAPTQVDIDLNTALAEVQHRVKNHLAMIVGMIRMQARGGDGRGAGDFDTLARRVETLQLLYEEMSDGDRGESDAGEEIALGAYLSRVANAIAHLDGRSGVRVNIEAEKLRVPFEVATQLGLILSELMTNSLQHAFSDRAEGLLEIEAKSLSNGVFRLVVSDDGAGLPEGLDWPEDGNLGGRIVTRLVDGLEAKLDVMAGDVQGTTITLDVPSGILARAKPQPVDA